MRRTIYFIFSLGVTVSVLGYLFTHVTLEEFWQLVRGIDKRGLLIFVTLSMAMSVFRTWRYQLLLKVNGYRVPSPTLFLVVLVRNFFSDLLPARTGSLIYVFILTTRLGVSLETATSSFALAFLFDIVAIVPLIVIAVIAAGPTIGLSSTTIIGASIFLCILVTALILLLPACCRLLAEIALRFPALSDKAKAKISALSHAVERDIETVREAGLYFRVMILSVFIRLGKYGGLYFFLYALLVPLGYSLADLNVSKVFIGLCVPELAASLPISGISGFGAYEGAWLMIFQLLGFPEKIAQLTSISHHLLTQIYGYLIGVSALLILLLPIFKSVQARQSEEPLLPEPLAAFLAKLGLTCSVVGLVVYVIYSIPMNLGY